MSKRCSTELLCVRHRQFNHSHWSCCLTSTNVTVLSIQELLQLSKQTRNMLCVYRLRAWPVPLSLRHSAWKPRECAHFLSTLCVVIEWRHKFTSPWFARSAKLDSCTNLPSISYGLSIDRMYVRVTLAFCYCKFNVLSVLRNFFNTSLFCMQRVVKYYIGFTSWIWRLHYVKKQDRSCTTMMLNLTNRSILAFLALIVKQSFCKNGALYYFFLIMFRWSPLILHVTKV